MICGARLEDWNSVKANLEKIPAAPEKGTGWQDQLCQPGIAVRFYGLTVSVRVSWATTPLPVIATNRL